MSDQYDGPELARQVRMLREENERLRAELAAAESVIADFPATEQDLDGYKLRAERAEAERDALRADAERYRWLRKHHYKPRSANIEYDNSMMLSFYVSGVWSDNMDPRVLDGCIDAAMQRGKEQNNSASAGSDGSATGATNADTP